MPDQADPQVTYNFIEKELKQVADLCGEKKVVMGKINKYAAHMFACKTVSQSQCMV